MTYTCLSTQNQQMKPPQAAHLSLHVRGEDHMEGPEASSVLGSIPVEALIPSELSSAEPLSLLVSKT